MNCGRHTECACYYIAAELSLLESIDEKYFYLDSSAAI
jgi:hypothetical protein